MKQFLILSIFAMMSFTGLQAQSNIEINEDEKLVVVKDTVVELVAFKVKTLETEVAAKKKDILNAKINSKLKGIVDLFFVAGKSIIS